MEIWILISLAAAAFQTVRFMLQKQLAQATLSASGATFARFVYSAPVAIVLAGSLMARLGVPEIKALFWAYGALGGVAQILATVATVTLFGRRNFAVGMTFIKTEVLLTALIGFVVLGDRITGIGVVAIVLGMVGVVTLSRKPGQGAPGWRGVISPSAGLGLLAGTLFGVSAVCYRGASLEVMSDVAFLRALVTLAAVTGMQMLAMSVWLTLRDAPQIGAVISAWRSAGWIGLTSMGGSLCWFWAFTLQNAAYVKAVGQIEVAFGLLATVLFFREKITGREMLGIALITLSVLALVVFL